MQRAKTLVFVVCAALLGAPAIEAQLSFTGVTRQLTTNPATQLDPAISGNLVVFTDLRNGNEDIYYYDLSSGTETQVTLSTANQRLNDVDGSRIVYTDMTPPSAHINLYDVTTGTTVPFTSLSADQNPRIDGDIVVFEQGPPTNPDVIAIDLGSGTEFPVAATAAVELWPVVSGRRVAYERRATPGDLTEIVVVDLDTGSKKP